MKTTDPLIIRGFATQAELEVLAAWAMDTYAGGYLKKNATVFRNYNLYRTLPPCPTFEAMRERLVERLGLQGFQQDPWSEDFMSVITPGGFVHPHTDPALPGLYHARANLLCGFPEAGAMPVIAGVRHKIDPGDLWMFLASEAKHFCELVAGTRPRINCSFGFQVPPAWWEALEGSA